jgi:hypothetical protein
MSQKQRTINCKAGFGEVRENKLVLVAWRGEERITVRLELEDYELVDLIEKACDLAHKRKAGHDEMSRRLRESAQRAAERI